MAVVVQIGSEDKSALANTVTFSKSTRETGVASCDIRGNQGVRRPGQHFRIWESHGTTAWGGTIDSVSTARLRPGSTEEIYRLSCVSWESRFTKRFCGSKVYRTETASERIIDLVASYAPNEGILVDPGNISATATAEQLGVKSYIGMSLADAIDDICQVGKDTWFINPGAYLFCKPRNSSIASSLIFTNATENFFDPVIEEDRNDYFNRIKLAIAFTAFAPQSHEIVGDGVLREWTLTVGATEIAIDNIVSAELNGVPLTLENYDQSPDADWTYQYGTGKIRQHADLPVLTSGDTVNITLYVVGQNIITVEDSDDIAARQAIEDDATIDASGIYEGWFEDLTIGTVEGGQTRAAAILKDHNPHQNGADAGTLPRKYIFKARGFITGAEEIQPGYTVQYENNSPSTGGLKTLLIETVSARQIGARDPVGDPTGGFLEYTITCVDYVESTTAGDYFVSLGSNTTGSGSGSVTVNTSTGGEVVAPAGNVTSLMVSTVYVLKEGRWVRQLHCKALRPDPVGTFDAIALYLEEPDFSSGPPANLLGDGSGDWNGSSSISDPGFDPVPKAKAKITADNQVVVIDDLLPVNVPIQGRVYFNSINSAGQENPLVRANQTGASPSVAYISQPPDTGQVTGGLGEEYAPTLLSVSLAAGANPTYRYQTGGDLLWCAHFDNITYRTDDVRFPRQSGFKIVLEYPEGNREIDSTHSLLTKASTRDDHPVRAVGFAVKAYFVSVDKDGNTNTIQANTPSVTFMPQPQMGPTGKEWSNAVKNLRLANPPQYVLNADGQRELQIGGYFEIDSTDPRTASGRVMLIRNGSHAGAHEILLENAPPGAFVAPVFGFPIVDETDTYLYVVSINTNGWYNSYVASGPNATPRVGPFTLPKPPLGIVGIERAPLATGLTKKSGGGFVDGIKYNWQTGGDPTYQIGIVWDDVDSTTQPQTGGYDIVYEYPDGRIGQVAGVSINDVSEWVSPEYPLTTNGSFTVLLVTWDVNGRLNSHTAPQTPRLSFNIVRQEQPSSGVAGGEWTANLLTFDASTPVVASPDQGGQNPTSDVTITVGQPVIAGYDGWVVMAISPSGDHILMSGVLKDNTTIVKFPFVPVSNETWTLYGLTQDINGRRNTYNPSLTPKEIVILGPTALGIPGYEYATPPLGVAFSAQSRLTTDGIWQQRYLINWTVPIDPKWGAVRVYEFQQMAFNNFNKTTPVELATLGREQAGTFYTEWREMDFPTVAPALPVYRTVYVVSVDVNGKENSYAIGYTAAFNNVIWDSGGGALNLKRASPSSFNPTEFNFDASGLFQMNNLSVDKLKVGSILKVGGGPTQKPGQIGVFNEADAMIAWAGKTASGPGTFWHGIWSQNAWIGGSSPVDAPLKCVNGVLTLDNVPFTVNLNGVRTEVRNVPNAGGQYAGLIVSDSAMSANTNQISVTPYWLTLVQSATRRVLIGGSGITVENNATILVDGQLGGKYQYRHPFAPYPILDGANADVPVGPGYINKTLSFRGGLYVGWY